MCLCAFPFACRSTHVVPIHRSSEPFPSLVAVWRQLVGECPSARELFLYLRIIFVRQCLQFHIFEFFCGFPCSLSCVEVIILKRLNHHSHVSCDGASLLWGSRSNLYDSVAIFFSTENKKLMLSANVLCSVQMSTYWTQQHNTVHTFPIYHSCASDDCRWHNQMARCQMFMAQITLVDQLKSAFHTCTPDICKLWCKTYPIVIDYLRT